MTRPLRGRRAVATNVALAAVVIGSVPARMSAQGRDADSVRVSDAGPGLSGRLLRDALAAPHVTRYANRVRRVDFPRDSTFATTLIVLGGSATVASRVSGDVIVVDGDLFLHPGAEISGRAVAIGGCVYNSTLATVRGGRVCFRDNTFVVRRGAGGETTLAYQERVVDPPAAVSLRGIKGFRVPAYDRVNGVSLAWGPTVTLGAGRVVIDPLATYRSDLGAVDPAVEFRASLRRRISALLTAARGTFTNERWIRSDLVNAATALAVGTDVRNYYRADRVDARLNRAVEREFGTIDLFAGALTERARSVDPTTEARSAPYSLTRRRDREDGMLRPNPQGTDGRITSAVAGAAAALTRDDLSATLGAHVELPLNAPNGRFVQTVADAATSFQTFGAQRLEVSGHLVLTAGDSTPRQRYGYLGGPGTLPTEDVLRSGGDEMLFVEGIYLIPVARLRLPLVGSPTLGVRYAAGSAGVRELPRFTQNVGARLSLRLLNLDVMINPSTRAKNFGLGIALPR